MANILFLAHRLPYPPNKGDKVRSYHLLRHLAERHQVHLGTFVDDPDDLQHLPMVHGWCASVHARNAAAPQRQAGQPARPGHGRGADRGVLPQPALGAAGWHRLWPASASTPSWCFLRRWRSTRWPTRPCRCWWTLSMSIRPSGPTTRRSTAGRMSWLYAREGRLLLACERRVAAQARRSFFATDKEAALFRSLAPEVAQGVEGMDNGVDADVLLRLRPTVPRPLPPAKRRWSSRARWTTGPTSMP